jgi:hypothetical protein
MEWGILNLSVHERWEPYFLTQGNGTDIEKIQCLAFKGSDVGCNILVHSLHICRTCLL